MAYSIEEMQRYESKRWTEHFAQYEFECHCGKCELQNDVRHNLKILAENLEIFREHIESPINIMSGYRCESHNESVVGAKRSQHLKGKAADIKVKGEENTPHHTYNILSSLMDSGLIMVGGLHEYSTFVHYDIRGVKARW